MRDFDDFCALAKLLTRAADVPAVAADHAEDLGCAAELEALPALLARGGGAGRQRAIHEIAGMSAVTRELTEITGRTKAHASTRPDLRAGRGFGVRPRA
jgi:hypothetical protein